MLFSSLVFLFFFLPLVVLLYFCAPPRLRNAVLLSASLLFYAWGEGRYVLLMLASIALNWYVGVRVHGSGDPRSRRRWVLWAVVGNLTALFFFKYANFAVNNLNPPLQALLGATPIVMSTIHLPIGISFFTFQALSYVVDVYRGDALVQRKPSLVALYISLFPQLIAGPIVRYRDVARQLADRRVSLDGASTGLMRFATGLGKKVLLANPVGEIADMAFGLSHSELSTATAWLGCVCYTAQIYFDFSGYSDMAIGLGRMLGFVFPENFNYPYVSQSITEFWRRWHISLSSWFRDYLYIPLGGNRRGPWQTYRNLFIVFLLCGLWHGAAWNFVFWGILHGGLLVAERVALGRALQKVPRVLRHTYTLVAVMAGWVLFRAESLPAALGYIDVMVSPAAPSAAIPVWYHLDSRILTTLVVAACAATPLPRMGYSALTRETGKMTTIGSVGHKMAVSAVLFVSVVYLAAGTHNPFIYFRF